MKSDRELLELAAKAAGEGIVFYGECWRAQNGHEWNPLTNSEDAFELAVKLRLNIDHNHPADQQRWVAAELNGCEGCYAPVSCVEDEFDDEGQRATATRRAITRAAAAIQEAKEGV